jgi:hypothetical protein
MRLDNFEVISPITEIETSAVRRSVRALKFLQATYGRGRWRKLKGVATVRFEDGTIRRAEVHWARSPRHRQTSNEDQAPAELIIMARQKTEPTLAICIDNSDYELSLERRKVYAVLPDAEAAKHHYVRVIDETGEDYLFPASRFVLLNLPREVQAAVLADAQAR